jgi:hypothetical protein
MKCERCREGFPDYLAGSLSASRRAELIGHLDECAACARELKGMDDLWKRLELLPEIQPSPQVDSRFQTMLQGYRAGLEQSIDSGTTRLGLSDWMRNWWNMERALQFALVLLLFGSGVLAGWGWRRGAPANRNEHVRQVQELRNEVLNLKEQMALALLEQKSASERLRGVEWTSQLDQPDDQILGALVRALNSDPNVNIRLAAIEALQPFARQALVKKALIDSLPRQQSPLVQIELIHLLVEKHELDSTPVLKSLTESRELDESVRERARWGLSQLGV